MIIQIFKWWTLLLHTLMSAFTFWKSHLHWHPQNFKLRPVNSGSGTFCTCCLPFNCLSDTYPTWWTVLLFGTCILWCRHLPFGRATFIGMLLKIENDCTCRYSFKSRRCNREYIPLPGLPAEKEPAPPMSIEEFSDATLRPLGTIVTMLFVDSTYSGSVGGGI